MSERRTGKEPGRTDDTTALFVRIPRDEAEKLDRASFELKAPKRELVAALVARYVDPSTDAGLDSLRALEVPGTARAEVPQPRPDSRSEPASPTVGISRSSEWTAGLQRSVREFAERRGRPPLVRATLDGGEQLFLGAITPGPAGDFVTMTAYGPGEEAIHVVLVRLDAIQRVDILAEAPSAAEEKFLFEPRSGRVGFASES
jgi:hypothetical protein